MGNLTITFNKPIIIPKMVIHNENRTISYGGLRTLENLEPMNYWNIEEVIELWVESDFYTNEREEIRIYNFTL